MPAITSSVVEDRGSDLDLQDSIEGSFEEDPRVYCTHCGHLNPNDARFCAKCGSPLEADTTVTLTPVDVEDDAAEDFPFPHDQLEPGQALLLVKRGPNAGSTFLVEKDV